jgi:hypothetical protein
MRKAVALAFVLMAALMLSAQPLGSGTQQPNGNSDEWCLLISEPGAPLPKPVVHVIMNSKGAAFARKVMREEGKDPYLSAPLSGIRVHITPSGGPTYLVGGSGPMTGGDNRWFWMVQQSGGAAKVLLTVSTGCVHIDRKSTRGYRDIETEWSVPGYRLVREYRWDGHVYKLHREYHDDKVR